MRLSPAPNDYPSGTRPVAVGAGVQFARSSGEFSWEPLGCERSENRPLSNGRACLTADAEHAGNGWGSPQGEPATQFGTASPSWDEGYSSGLSARADDDAEQVQGGSVAFTFSRLARASLGLATQAMERLDEACPGKARQHVTPRNGGNFSGLAIASLGWAWQCSTGRGNSATRGDIAGQFSEAFPGMARPGKARHGCNATQSGIWGQFLAVRHATTAARRRLVGQSAARRGNTPPGAVIPDTFPSTNKHPLHAGQRSKG